MANSLGTLTLDLIARIGGFTGPLDKAEQAASKAGKGIGAAADAAANGLFGLSTAAEFVRGALAGISVGALFSTFINNTIDAENEQIQLAAVLRSTANAAGFTSKELNGMADSLADVTNFSGGDITRAQTALLAFTGIVGKEFPRALQAAADMAARTGQTVQQSAETIGRALDVPSAGLSALSKQGFRFTEEQKKLVDAFESVGDVAAAQGIVLQGLEGTYGGAAAAAKDSLGGALEGLKNAFNDLLTNSGGLDSAKNVLVDITDVLKSPEARDALVLTAKAATALAGVLTLRLAASGVVVAASFVSAQISTFQLQLALAKMGGTSTATATGLLALSGAARVTSAAMALMGGPVGLVLIAASAIAYFALTSDEAETSATNLADKVDYLNKSFDGFTKNQARATLQEIAKSLQDAQLKAIDAESAVLQYQRLLRDFPKDTRQREWNESLIAVQGELDTARQAVEQLGGQIQVLNGIIASPVTIPASKVYVDLAAKIDEAILVADKKTDADKLQARIGAGLIKGLKDGEGELLVAKQKTLDTLEASIAANKNADDDAKTAAKNAASAALAIKKQGDDAITGYERQIELLDETSGARAKATEAAKVAFDTESGKLKDISGEQKARLIDLARELDSKKALVKANDELNRSAEYAETLRLANQNAQDGFDSELAGAGSGDKLKDRLKQNLAIEQDYQKQREDLYKQFNKATLANDPEAENRYASDIVLLEEALAERIVKQQDYYNQLDAQQNDWLSGVSSAWQNYSEIATDYQQQAADATSQILGDATSSLSSSLDGLIMQTMTVGEAFANLGAGIAGSALKALEDFAAQWLITQALQLAGISAVTTATVASEGVKTAAKVTADGVSTASTLGSLAATTAASVASAVTTLASWAPAALVASIGSFGAAAVVGGAALIGAFALIKGISGGFEKGGYTGDGAASDAAGIVHKGEYVFTKAQTSAIGRDRLAAIAANGYATGGFVMAPRTERVTSNLQAAANLSQTTSDVQQRNGKAGDTNVTLVEDASRAGQTRTRLDDDGVTQMTDIFVSQIYGDGPLGEAFQNRYGVRGRGE